MTSHLDISRIVSKHYQGSHPAPGRVLYDAGFRVLVLCALPDEYEAQYKLSHYAVASGAAGWRGLSYDTIEGMFPGLKIIRAPNDDDYDRPLTRSEIQIACSAASAIQRAMMQGRRVLVCCAKGRNRSGLVSALALCERFGCGGLAAIAKVRAGRQPDCSAKVLENPQFLRALAGIKPAKIARIQREQETSP
jgi:protein-tyrosine phosphatase